jgi:hypothetical protein
VLNVIDGGIPRKEEEEAAVGTFGVSMPSPQRYLRPGARNAL